MVKIIKHYHNGLPLVCIYYKYTNLTEKETGELKRFAGVGPTGWIYRTF